MRLRIARKILSKLDEDGVWHGNYTKSQIAEADRRYFRSPEAKEAMSYWCLTMETLGVSGRAQALADMGSPDMAFDLLMRTPIDKW